MAQFEYPDEDDSFLARLNTPNGAPRWFKEQLLCTLGESHDLPLISTRISVQATYVAMRMDGQGHNLAEMFALQQPPQVQTDAVFLEGHANGNQFEKTPWLGDYYAKPAKDAGVDIKGAVYKSTLANFPGDPEAWVRDRHDVQALCEKRGWTCHGAVNLKASEVEAPPPDVAIAEDIVEQKILDMMDANPDLEHTRCYQDVYEEARAIIKPHWANDE